MQTYETEEQQVEALKKWWKDNYKMFLSVSILAIASVLGVQYYQENKRLIAEAASDNYSEILSAAENNQKDVISGRTQILKDEYNNSSYTAMAALIKAKSLYQDNKTDEALSELNWVLANNTDAVLNKFALLSKAKLLHIEGKTDESISLLDQQLTSSDDTENTFSGLFLELKGDMLSAQGKKKDAYEAYEKAMSQLLLMGGNAELLRMKQNQLGVSL